LRIVYFDCFSGASGDMLLGGLLDAGTGGHMGAAPASGLALDDLLADLAHLQMGVYRLIAQRVTRQGLTGTHLRVLAEAGNWPAVNLPAIERIVGGSSLPERVRTRSLAVFRRLAQVEAAVHGTTVEEIHFHELGAVDTLVDVVGFVCALERLGIEAVYCSPLPQGGGSVETEHGLLPVPAPATLALLAQAGAPTVPGPIEAELLTPTGAALLAEFATFERPAMTVQAVGYGFGTKEFAFPNALRVWIGEPAGQAHSPAPTPDQGDQGDEVVELACNLDDVTGEALGYAMERLLAEGALDAWFTPIQMKKNRPGVQVSVLARPEDAPALAALLLRETPTLGVRWQVLSRTKADREMRQVETPWGTVRVKVKLLAGKAVAVSPEYDDCARLAAQADVPLAEVMDAARGSFDREQDGRGAREH
jgi:uncharacterized protein (TIGR00299 family) protein